MKSYHIERCGNEGWPRFCYYFRESANALFGIMGIHDIMHHLSIISGPRAPSIIPGGLMSTTDDKNLRQKLAQLRQEHRDLDEAILALEEAAQRDQLRLTRLKKRKLGLKDEIARLEDQLLPDIIA